MRTPTLNPSATAIALVVLALLLSLAPAAAQEGPEVAVLRQGEGPTGNGYDPAQLQVQAGQTVTWTNVDDSAHTVTAEDGSFDSGAMAAGATFSVTFPEAATVPYYCTFHADPGGTSQNGTITVVAGDEDPDDPPRVDGTDPVDTALAWSSQLPDGGAPTALIGTDAAFADSLASGAAQGVLDAPLLLTARDALDPRVSQELARLGTDRVIILGGTAAISAGVEAELAARVGTVDRAGGSNRMVTAQAVADLVAPDATRVIVARAFGEGSAAFADSLGAGAVAAHTGVPVVLTPTASLDPDLATWLQQRGVQDAVIAGGDLAVSRQVEAELAAIGIAVTRYGGDTRFSTAAALQAGLADPDAPTTLVEGTADLAWASGFAAGRTAAGGILLSAGDHLPQQTRDALVGRGPLICGPTVTAEVCAQARELAAS